MKRKVVILIGLILVLSSVLLVGCTREVSDEKITVTFQDKEYAGTFTGTFEKGQANGQGEFKYKNSSKNLNYKGTFKEGAFSDKGTLDTNFLLVKFNEADRVGHYKGDVVNGTPEGDGTFTTKNDEDIKYTYTGKWKKGLPNGVGTLKWYDDDSMTLTGNFVKGVFTPDFKDLLVTLGTNPSMPYTISEKANTFLSSHKDLFPADSIDKLKPYINKTIEYKHLNKSNAQYGDQVIEMSGTVSQIFEDTYDDDSAKYSATEIYLMDDNYNYYWICYPGTCDLYEGDSVTIYGIPLDSSSYDNVGGGTTLVQVMAGCFIQK